MSNFKVGFIAALLISISLSAIPKHYCTCQNIQIEEICNRSTNCIWLNTGCIQREIQCQYLEKQKCLIYPQCYYHNGICLQFVECGQLKDSCSRFANFCRSSNDKCMEAQDCNLYANQEECKLRDKQQKLCYWNNNFCETTTQCNHLPISFRSDEACRSELSYCTLNIQGYGCQESALKCIDHLYESQCFWNFDKSTQCIWDNKIQKCIDKLCEFIPSNDASDCSINNCNFDGQGCVTRKDCVFYSNLASCDIDHEGKKCIYFQNKCFQKTCKSAPTQFMMDVDCILFGGKNCIVNEAGGCKTGNPICSLITFQADCLFVDSCIWEDQVCRNWICEDAKESTSHSECLQFNCIGRSIGGCQKRPKFCDGFKIQSECVIGSQESPCLWLNEQCWPEAVYCSKLSQNQCSHSDHCYQTGTCKLKSIENVPSSFNTHQQCNEWLDDYTVGIFGGCVKLKPSCEDYVESQCFLTISKELCAWDNGSCTVKSCRHLKFNTNAGCQKQTLIAQKCQLAQSGDRCTQFLGSLEHPDPESTYRILIPLESDQAQTSPSVQQIVEGTPGLQYGYGYYVRFFAFYPQILNDGFSENYYFLSRLRINTDQNSNYELMGDRALAVYFQENVFSFFANSQTDLYRQEFVNAPNLLDGVWILLYFSYSQAEQKAQAFIKFGNNAEEFRTFVSIQQNPVHPLIFTFGGKEFEHDIINGYFENIVIAFGDGAYIDNFSDVRVKMGAQLEVPLNMEKRVLSIINQVQTDRLSQSEGTFKIEIEREHKFFDSYSFGGWYFLDPNPNPTPPPWYTFFRLRQKDFYGTQIKFGERTLYLVVFWGQSTKDIYLCTYSYQNIMLTSGDPNKYLIVGEAILSQWLYISVGYSKIESKVSIDQIGLSYHRTDVMNDINHLYSQFYYLIVGNEENLIVQGKRAYINFVIGDSKMDPGFAFDSQGFFSHPLIPFQVYPSSVITEEVPKTLEMQIEKQDCFTPSWNCQDSRYFCEINCNLRYCEQQQLSVDEACSLTLPSLKCRTNGEICVKRSTCEVVQEQQGCTFSQFNQLCVWQNDKCYLRTCELADKSLKNLAECENFLPNHDCIPLRNGGCTRKLTCFQIETQDACVQDLDGNICYWIEDQCVDSDSSCLSVCGDGILDPKSEQCDDANHFPYDGCHECEIQCAEECLKCDGLSCFACKENQGWYLKGDQCYTECGDDVLAGLEECDDGNLINQDGCNSSCKLDCFAICLYCEKGVCKLCPQGYIEYYNTCQTLCGDGIKAGEESCDDGNSAQFDGCDGCLIQKGFYCMEEEYLLSQCNPISDYQIFLSQLENLQFSQEQHILVSFSQNTKIIRTQNLLITFYHISNPETGFYSIGDQLVLVVRLKYFVPYYRVQISIPLDRLIIGSTNTQAIISDTIQIAPDLFIQDDLREQSRKVNIFNSIILIILLVFATVSYFLKCPHIFWNTMDKLQEMSYLKYINVPFPEHLDAYLSTFELFQISKFLEYIGVPSLENIYILEYPVLKARGKLSYENAFFLGNIISLVLIYLGSLVYFQSLRSCYLKMINGKVLNKFLFQLYNFANQKMLFLKYASYVLKQFKIYLITFPFSGFLRLFYFSIYELYKSIFLQISTQFKFSTFYLFNYIMAYVALILSVITIRYYSLIASSHYSHQYFNDLFEGFSMKSPPLRQYPTSLVLKKIASMALLILFQDAPDVQISGLICLFLANVLLVHFQDPFSSRLDFYKSILQNYSQIISLILMLLYLMPSFKLTYDQVNNIAWTIIGMQTLIVVINLFVDLASLILNVNSNLSKNLAST